MEQQAIQQLQMAYAMRYNAELLIYSRKDVATLLGENIDSESIHQQLIKQTPKRQDSQYRHKTYGQER